MRNFGRVLVLALHYKVRVMGLFLCATLVGLLWGANIGSIYPLIEITLKGQSPQAWIEGKINQSQKRLDEQTQTRESLQTQLAQANREHASKLRRKIQTLNLGIDSEQQALELYRTAQPWIDRYLPADPFHLLALVVGMLLLGTMLKSLFYVGHSLLSDLVSTLTIFQVRKQFYRSTLEMDEASLSSEGSGKLLSRFTYDMECLNGGLRFLLQVGTREPLKMLACFAGAAFICWRLLLFSLIIVPLGVLAMGWLSRLLKQANRKALEGMSQLYSVLEESFQGLPVVKAYTMEGYERARFHHTAKEFALMSMRTARYQSLTSPVTEFVGISTVGITLLAGAYLVLSEETSLLGIHVTDRPLSLGSMLTFYGLLIGMSDPARKLAGSYNHLQRAAAAADRVYSLLDREPQIRNAEEPVALARHQRQIELRNVSFSYHGETPVLKNIDLTIGFGETVAIVGPNGCGKSTLLRLLLRFYEPTSGQVIVDGHDLRQLDLRAWRKQIGLVTQEPLLFQETIWHNIRYGTLQASEAEVIAAAKKARAHEFIMQLLPQGYDTRLAERGSSLSGGQRQRIALARAILRDPSLLLLDEATSQIDLESEQKIHQALQEFVKGRTTFIVTHRLSTLALASRIIVMRSGEIVDVGTHGQLMQRCPFYSRLHEMQFRESA